MADKLRETLPRLRRGGRRKLNCKDDGALNIIATHRLNISVAQNNFWH